jgi:hypothetical protein
MLELSGIVVHRAFGISCQVDPSFLPLFIPALVTPIDFERYQLFFQRVGFKLDNSDVRPDLVLVSGIFVLFEDIELDRPDGFGFVTDLR